MMARALFLALAALAVASGAQAETLYGLTTDNRLITFDSAAPSQGAAVSLSGLSASEKLLGLDARPTNGLLYTLSNLGNVYTLNASTGAATFVGALKSPIGGTLLAEVQNAVLDLVELPPASVAVAGSGNAEASFAQPKTLLRAALVVVANSVPVPLSSTTAR